MGHVKGIGGLFFRARDPEALNAWYRERLGIGAGCSADETGPINEWVWNVTAGPVVFSAFKAVTDYFAADRQYMINLRVDRSEEPTSELQSLMRSSYADFCLTKKKTTTNITNIT